jgi:gliding motility-associated-like protein
MRNSFYKAILCLAGIILFVGTSHAQLGATVAVTNTTCGLNNGSAIVTPTGGSGYTYAWSGGIASVTNTANNIPAGNYTVTVTSAGGIVPIYTETFGPPAPAGWNLLVSSSAATGQTNEAQPNFWAIDDVEGGQAVGACGGAGSATGNGNNTLYITSVSQAVPGCAYDAGGLCGFPGFNCTGTSVLATSPNISTTGYTGLTLGFQYITVGDGTNDYLGLAYSVNGGVTWNPLSIPAKTASPGGCSNINGDSRSPWTAYTIALPAACNNIANLQIGFNWVNDDDGVGTDPPAGIDNVVITTTSVGSSVIEPFTIAASAVPAAPTAGPVTQPTCATPDGTFTITNYNAAYTYTFTPATGVTQSGATVTAPPGSYTITATSAPCTSPSSATITVSAAPGGPATPTVSGVTQPTCTTATGSFTITNYNATYTYTVTPAGTTQAGATFTGTPGSYTITATNAGCSSSGVNVTINPAPAAPAQPTAVAATQPTCANPDGTITITNYNAAYTYTITPATGVTQSGNTVTAPAGSYTITASSGGCTSTASASVTLNPAAGAPAQPILSAVTQPTCTTPTGSFTITNYNAAYTYTISPAGATQSGSTITASAGIYTVIATITGCSSAASAPDTVNAQPSNAPITITATRDSICLGSSDVLTATGGTPGTYVWSGGTLVTPVNANSITVSSINQSNYTYTVTEPGCTVSATITISVINVSATLQSTTQPSCGLNNGIIYCFISPFNAQAILLKNGTVVSQGAQTQFSNLSPGTYTFIATDAAAGCSDTLPLIILIDNSVYPTFDAINITPDKCYGNNNGKINVTVGNCSGGCTFAWSQSAANTTDSAINLATGSYTFSVSEGGCTNIDTVIVVSGPLAPLKDSLTVYPDHCSHSIGAAMDSTTGGTGPYSYVWSMGNSLGDSVSQLTGDSTVYVTVTDSHGCMDTVHGFVGSTPGPHAYLTQSDTICASESNGLLIVTATSGVAPFNYLWSNGQTSSVDAGLSVGNYTVSVYDKAGCDTVLQGTVPAYQALNTYTITPANAVNLGQTVEIQLLPNVPVTNVTWSPYIPGSTGSTLVAFKPQQSTIYTVTISYGLSCEIIDSIEVGIVIDSTSKFDIPNTFTPNGDGLNDNFKLITYPDVSSFHIWIYDRWGNKVYESTDVSFEWNGLDQYANDAPLHTGVYAYVLQYETIDGNGKKTIGGNISLVK